MLIRLLNDGTCFEQPVFRRGLNLGRTRVHQVVDRRQIVDKYIYRKSPKRGGVAVEIG